MKKLGYVGKLEKTMYGTRAAPKVWQEVVRPTLLNRVFDVNVKFPNLYYHKKRNVKIVAHVSDFLRTGCRVDMVWVKHSLEKECALPR